MQFSYDLLLQSISTRAFFCSVLILTTRECDGWVIQYPVQLGVVDVQVFQLFRLTSSQLICYLFKATKQR